MEKIGYLCKAGRSGRKANQQAMFSFLKLSIPVALKHGLQLKLREYMWERQSKKRRESYTVDSWEIIHFLIPVYPKEILSTPKEAVRLNGLGTCKRYWCECLIGCLINVVLLHHSASDTCRSQTLKDRIFSTALCLLRIILLDGVLLARTWLKLNGFCCMDPCGSALLHCFISLELLK